MQNLEIYQSVSFRKAHPIIKSGYFISFSAKLQNKERIKNPNIPGIIYIINDRGFGEFWNH